MKLPWSKTPPPAPPSPTATMPNAAPSPDHAWKALGLVVDWIKHAETKAGATLAATGVTGGLLYNLIKDVKHPGGWVLGSAIACGASVFAAGTCAGLVLWPRLRIKEQPTSLLYFRDIAQAHPTGDTYSKSLVALTKDIDALVEEIARQGWANARVAHRKYLWGDRAIRLFLLALVTLSITAAIRAAS